MLHIYSIQPQNVLPKNIASIHQICFQYIHYIFIPYIKKYILPKSIVSIPLIQPSYILPTSTTYIYYIYPQYISLINTPYIPSKHPSCILLMPTTYIYYIYRQYISPMNALSIHQYIHQAFCQHPQHIFIIYIRSVFNQ